MTPSPPRRDAVVDLLAAENRPLHAREVAERLGVDERGFPALRKLLDELAFDQVIVGLDGQRFKVTAAQAAPRGPELAGVLNVNPRGFGFVGAGLEGDVYIPPEAMGGAMHGDTVSVRVASRSRRGIEGYVVGIVKRRSARVGGTLRRRGKSAWLEPDDARLRGPIVLATAGAEGEDGDACVVTITRFPVLPDENPEGTIVKVLGAAGDPNVEIEKILVREGVEEEHPPEAVREAESYGDEVSADALVGRCDLTGIPLPTIDPEDARDHDDAVWVVRHDDGSYTAWVAIADVSHYVRPGTPLDAAAEARGSSIYFPDRAIPMLPRALSSNLCSLLPHVTRLCLCAQIDVDPTGTPTRTRLVEGFMRSAAKLTYPGVARALGFTSEPERSEEAEAMRDDLRVMWDLSRVLRGRRMRRGALDFDLPEAKVLLHEDTGAPLGIEKRSRDPGVSKAYQLIEEMMLLANEAVARWLVERDVPTIFRDHGPPDLAKLERFATMCSELGIDFDPEESADPKFLSSFLHKLANHPQKQVLHMLLLRAMKQAIYDIHNIGHFGLASSAYLHFTSPIRRYPDLAVHRGVRAVLRGEPVDRSDQALEKLKTAASISSDRERKIMEIEREVVDLYRALFMRDKVGAELEGTVSGLVGTGVFVLCDDPFIDVLVRMESLGSDSYAIDDEGLRVIGARSGDRIALGDRMRVCVEDVSIVRRTVYARRLAGAEPRDDPRVRRKVKSKKTSPRDAKVSSRKPAGKKFKKKKR